MKYLAVLGRQPEISLAELKAIFDHVEQKTPQIATFESENEPNIDLLGGSLKLAKSLENISPAEYLLTLPSGKITLGVSDYSVNENNYSSRDIKNVIKIALKLKNQLKKAEKSVRILPNDKPWISSAAAHHNSLGRKPKNIELIKFNDSWFTSVGSQNITAYAKRDQARPARDAKVGMLPPKLAQILINLCGKLPENATILDPFCGTGVVLQEALLIGYQALGSDKDERMVKYSEKNLEWLSEGITRKNPGKKPIFSVEQGDATDHKWEKKIDAVAAEIYLGQPMSQPPVDIKLKTEKQYCGQILKDFLRNLSDQIEVDTPVTLAIPAWLRPDGSYSRLNLLDEIENLGYNVSNMGKNGLLYAREGQIVAREIIVLRKK